MGRVAGPSQARPQAHSRNGTRPGGQRRVLFAIASATASALAHDTGAVGEALRKAIGRIGHGVATRCGNGPSELR